MQREQSILCRWSMQQVVRSVMFDLQAAESTSKYDQKTKIKAHINFFHCFPIHTLHVPVA